MKTGESASIPNTKPFSPWNIHHKYPSVLSVGWMLEGMNEEVALSSFPLMGTNRVSLRVIACGRGGRQLRRSSYSRATPLAGYLHLKHRAERQSCTFCVVSMAPVGVKCSCQLHMPKQLKSFNTKTKKHLNVSSWRVIRSLFLSLSFNESHTCSFPWLTTSIPFRFRSTIWHLQTVC